MAGLYGRQRGRHPERRGRDQEQKRARGWGRELIARQRPVEFSQAAKQEAGEYGAGGDDGGGGESGWGV